MRDAVRVALLARPGAGADRLRAALVAAGAELVLDADPTSLEPATLSGARAESVVVLLDAAVEEALDRLDPVLHDPAIDVLYEESEVAAAREGWDAARWTRHLSAKLLRHGDVLPPGREADDAPPRDAVEPDAPAVAAPAVAAPPPAAPSIFDPVAAEYDAPGPDLSLPEPMLQADPIGPDAPTAGAGGPGLDVQPGQGAMDAAPDPDWSSLTLALEGDAPSTTAPGAPSPSAASEPHAPHAGRGEAIRDFRRDLADIEQRIASMGLVADEPAALDADPAEAVQADADQAAPDALDPPPPAPGLAVPEVPVPEVPVPAAAPSAPTGGAVLVFAGIGGPDAVRQFLGALPDVFPRPVLIHQRLDGGRHDRLVQQMARATSLPVCLAAEGTSAEPGHVYILPPGLRVAAGDAGLRFEAGDDPMASLPAAESAVLMFSGSDTAMVDAAMDHAQAGALVAGQSPEDCYDAAAADALVARGAESGQPAELARRLAERWAA